MSELKGENTAGKSEQNPIIRRLIIAFLVIILVVFGVFLAIRLSTPENLANPKITHYHFRWQLLINGKKEDFSKEPYQEPYEKGQCSGDLTTEPIHFHDQKDQIVHIHWNNMTGGQLLKFYGLNKIGGLDDILGIRFDKFEVVKIHGNNIPKVEPDLNFYIYTGDENKYEERDLNEFLNQDFETFFKKTSQFNQQKNDALKQSNNDNIFNSIKVLAHGDEVDETGHTTEELEKINDLLGNVVIFIQKDEPNQELIKERFNDLTPLELSTCGG